MPITGNTLIVGGASMGLPGGGNFSRLCLTEYLVLKLKIKCRRSVRFVINRIIAGITKKEKFPAYVWYSDLIFTMITKRFLQNA